MSVTNDWPVLLEKLRVKHSDDAVRIWCDAKQFCRDADEWDLIRGNIELVCGSRIDYLDVLLEIERRRNAQREEIAQRAPTVDTLRYAPSAARIEIRRTEPDAPRKQAVPVRLFQHLGKSVGGPSPVTSHAVAIPRVAPPTLDDYDRKHRAAPKPWQFPADRERVTRDGFYHRLSAYNWPTWRELEALERISD